MGRAQQRLRATRRSRDHLASAALALILVAPGVPAADDDAVVANYVDAWNGAPGRLEAVLADDFVDQTSLLPLVDRSLFGMRLAEWRVALPDLRVTLLERASAKGREVLRLRYEGQPANPSGLVPFSGGRVSIEQTEWLTIAEGRITSRRAVTDDWTLPSELMFVPPPAAPVEAYAAERIASLGPGKFLESIAFAPDGRLFVSTGMDGAIVTLDAAGNVKPFAKLDVGAGGFMMCLAFDRPGTLYATVNSRAPGVHGVWRFDREGRASRVVALPPGSAPNGLALDDRGNLLVADSFAGLIWRVPVAGGPAEPWLRHRYLVPRPLVGRFPGANGMQRFGDAVIVAVSDRSLLLRIPILENGGPGAPEILASGLPGDDFAVASDGTLYVTTHPFNSVVRVSPDGERTVVAGPAQGVVGPTAAAFGPDGSLYVVNDGGLFRPLPGIAPVGSVVRLRPPGGAAK
jgi:sugar lactone lactonase YvrE